MKSNSVGVDAVDVHFGLVHGENFLVLGQSFRVSFIKRVVECVVEEYPLAVHLLDHLSGGVALAKSRYIEFGLVFKICLVKACVPFLGCKREIDFYFALGFFDSVVHFNPPKLIPKYNIK